MEITQAFFYLIQDSEMPDETAQVSLALPDTSDFRRRMAGMKRLRGTWLDPFRFGADRKLDRDLLVWFVDLLDRLPLDERADAVLAAPMEIRGYGPVREKAAEQVQARVAALMGAA